MRWAKWLLLALPGGAVIMTGTVFAVLFDAARTGKADLDELRVRGRVVLEALLTFGVNVRPNIVRALMAITNNEIDRTSPPTYLGDVTAPGGPSVGPMQVYRSTAKELGLWTPPAGASDADERDAYAALAGDFGWGIRAGVKVFKAKLEAAGGDVADAVRRYNGSGAKAQGYEAKALAFASETWPTGLA